MRLLKECPQCGKALVAVNRWDLKKPTGNTIAHFNFVFSLLSPELTDTFVVSGCSAGGLATFTWLETIAGYIHMANPKV